MTLFASLKNSSKVTCSSLLVVMLWILSVPAPAQTYPDFIQVVKQNMPSVVTVQVVKKISRDSNSEIDLPELSEDSNLKGFFGKYFNSADLPGLKTATGSGVFISRSGQIITAAHLVKNARSIKITVDSGKAYKAVLLGADQDSDIALLQIQPGNRRVPAIGNSDALQLGQWVLSIGAPFGLEKSVAQGIVSGLNRQVASTSKVRLLQTDVAVNPGNSGGPLFNTDGELVGINSQIYTKSGSYQGVSFAVPINTVLRIAARLARS